MEDHKQSRNIFVYTINNEDIIVNYSRNFPTFARENDWSSELSPEAVVGHSIFDFINGIETKHLYEILFEHCRRGKHIGPIPFRCDSPTERRFLELYLRPLSHDHIDIITKLLKTESRERVKTLEINVPRSEGFIRICSMCKKVAIPDDGWFEIEEALLLWVYSKRIDVRNSLMAYVQIVTKELSLR